MGRAGGNLCLVISITALGQRPEPETRQKYKLKGLTAIYTDSSLFHLFSWSSHAFYDESNSNLPAV
jgi:hypothetical protein